MRAPVGTLVGTLACTLLCNRLPTAPPGCPANIANARAAGFSKVGAYMYPGRNGDPADQATWLLGNLSEHSVGFDAVM